LLFHLMLMAKVMAFAAGALAVMTEKEHICERCGAPAEYRMLVTKDLLCWECSELFTSLDLYEAT